MNGDIRMKKILETIQAFEKGNYSTDHLSNGQPDELGVVMNELKTYGEKMRQTAFNSNFERRINNVLNIILKYTLLDFTEKAPISEAGDEIDAIAVGLNTLAEELEAKISEEKKHTEDLERLAIILETTADAVLMLDLDAKITSWNRGAENMFGYTAQDVVGKFHTTDFTAPKDKKRHLEAFEKVKNGQIIVDLRITRVHKNGSHLDVSVTLSPIYNKEGKVVSISAISRDITLQKKTEELLKKSEETFRLLVKSVKDYAIFKIDTAGFISSWNVGAENITGYKEEEIIGKHISVFYTEEQIKNNEPLQNIEDAVRNGDHYSLDLKLKKDGSTFLCEAVCTPSYNEHGELTGLSKVFKDVTEAKKAEEAIREGKEQIEAILNGAPSAVVVMDENDVIINWNPKAETMFGWMAEEVINKPMSVMPQPYYSEYRKGVQEFLRTGYGPNLNRIVEISAIKKSKEEFPVEMVTSAIKSKGKFIFISFINDITERKKTELALRNANEELNNANKELESFSYSVSHDLRAPLRAIHGYSSILLSDLNAKLNDKEKGMVSSILKNTQKMAQLIDDLLSFSRLGKKELTRKKIELKPIVESVLKNFEDTPSFKKTKVIIGELPDVWADSNLIAQVYQNLLSNAFKYSAMKEQPVVEIGSQKDKNEITYFIKDNGAGFNMAYYDKLFGVFQRLHDASEFEGTGVGLAIVKRIIDRHHGKVWANSVVGEGATFYFTLEPEPKAKSSAPLPS